MARVRFMRSSTSFLHSPSVLMGGSVVIIMLPVQNKREKQMSLIHTLLQSVGDQGITKWVCRLKGNEHNVKFWQKFYILNFLQTEHCGWVACQHYIQEVHSSNHGLENSYPDCSWSSTMEINYINYTVEKSVIKQPKNKSTNQSASKNLYI